jgi:probable phosphoglycerate mutase
VGEWTGLTRAEIGERWPDLLHAFVSGPSGSPAAGGPVTPPGGEPVDVVLDRVTAALGRVAGLVGPGGEAVAVTHGGVIRALERHLGREPEPLANLGATWVEASAEGRLRLGERVLLVDPHDVTVTVPRQL